jgi:hypothetical protein
MGLTIKIIKNVLNKQTHQKLLTTVESSNVCWFKGEPVKNTKDIQFNHSIYAEHNVRSDLYNDFIPLYKKLGIELFHTIRLNCNIRQHTNRIFGDYHIDSYDTNNNPIKNLMVAIYYLNTTDGKTLIKENNGIKEIECVANSVVIFSNTLQHTGTTQTDKELRYVLNLNYM